MGDIPDRPRKRQGGRRVVGSLKTGLHSVTVQMRRPSRYVPVMIAIGVGAFAAFGWPVIAWTQGPHVTLNDQALEQLVAVHRGSAPQESLADFTHVKALVLFDALPADGTTKTQGSFVVLRGSRVSSEGAIATALEAGGEFQTTVKGIAVRVRRHEDAIQLLIGATKWPVIDLNPRTTP
ncbi:MAG: hypothetical protein ACPGU1_18185 [Myxococcota bacterium]